MSDDGRHETEKERLDRNLNELLGELRVVMPGVQVLFAFLLAVPFNARFGQVSGFERGVYFVTLLSTAIATGFLMAPGALHRMEFRADDKRYVVFRSNRLALIGFAFLALAITSAVLLVTHFLYSEALAWTTTLVLGAFIVTLWYLIPFARLRTVKRAGGVPR